MSGFHIGYIIYLKNRHRYPRSTQCNYVRFTYIYPWNCTQIDKVEGISINHMHIKCLWYIRCATERQPTGNLSSHVVKRRRFVEVPRLWKLHQRSCHLREHLPRQRRTPGFQKAEKKTNSLNMYYLLFYSPIQNGWFFLILSNVSFVGG